MLFKERKEKQAYRPLRQKQRVNRPLAWFTAAFAMMSLLAGAVHILIVVALAAMFFVMFSRTKGDPRCFLFFLGGFAALVWFILYAGWLWLQIYQFAGKTVSFTATVSDYSTETDYNTSVDVYIDTVFGSRVHARLYVPTDQELKPGDRLSGTAYFTSGTEKSGSYASYASQGLFLLGSVHDDVEIVEGEAFSLRYLPQYLRHSIQEKIHSLFTGDCAALLSAFLVGDRSELSDSCAAALRRAGLSHLVAVSGLHVTFLVSLLLFVTYNNRWCTLLCIPFLVLFALMTGCSPSTMRAVFMECIVILAPFFGRETDGLCSLSAALLVLLAANPYSASSISLQLSFTSMLGILLHAARFRRGLGKWIPRIPVRPIQWLSAYIQSSFAMTAAASMFTLPLVAYYFDAIPLISPISNLLVVGVASWLFFAGAVTVLLGFVCMPLASVLAWPVRALALYVVEVPKLLVKIPFASLSDDYQFVQLWMGAICLIFLLTLISKWLRRHLYLPIGAGILSLFLVIFALRSAIDDANLIVQALNVGQGQSILFYSDGEAVAVDCGGNADNAGDILAESLIDFQVSHLDALVLTHYDSDHINGVEELFQQVQVDRLYLPDVEDDNGGREKVLAAAEEAGVSIEWVTEDETISFGSAMITIYAPIGDGGDNECGLSVQCTSGGTDVLITGDMSASWEEELAQSKQLEDIEVLIVAHHGSKYSTSEAFLDIITPEYAVISVGNNSYGHPTEETLQRLEEAGCVIYRTDEDGTVTLRFRETD